MSWFTRWQTSRQLVRSSLHVIRRHPRLLLFPVVSSACAIALALFFFSPLLVWLSNHGWPTLPLMEDFGHDARRLVEEGRAAWFTGSSRLAFYAYGAAIYLVSLFVAGFFNVAFYHEILRALAGESVSVRSGLLFAASRGRAILGWTLLAGTVGLVIRAIEDRLGWLGRIVMGFVGVAWSVAAVFAIPVIVRSEENSPFAVLRHSAATLKRTWGESIVGYAGIQFGGIAAVIGATLMLFLSVALAAQARMIGMMIGFGVAWLLFVIALGMFISVATHVYRCALYVYASEGVVPGPFTAELMDAGWRVRKR